MRQLLCERAWNRDPGWLGSLPPEEAARIWALESRLQNWDGKGGGGANEVPRR